ncbi:DNA alkylation repair protein [Planosporangium thailandense]|uniref:DNA alkylation repair protein n=1 Tax=Planosporangium thailandense TaxID=765197 RepID=UPI00197B17A5|nr:DNA alkylation repair protein [Planosporangium thailandense]
MDPTPLARTVLDRLGAVFGTAADAAQAGPMRAYMRDQFAFLGIPTPQRRTLSREVLAGLPRPGEDDLRATALACWELSEREYQYFACDWLIRHAGACSPAFLDTARALITTKSWWDTVDALAAHLVGAIVARYPEASATMDAWVRDENLWLARTAILHQLRYRERTDAERLFRYCLARAAHGDFFIRKAIGWALREYARIDPDRVRAFVRAHERVLSPLSVREALKHI